MYRSWDGSSVHSSRHELQDSHLYHMTSEGKTGDTRAEVLTWAVASWHATRYTYKSVRKCTTNELRRIYARQAAV